MKRTSLRIAGGVRHIHFENGIEEGNLNISIGYNNGEDDTLYFEVTMGEAEDIVKFLEGKIREYASIKK